MARRKNADVERYSGKKIQVPEGMPLKEARYWLEVREQKEEEIVSLDFEIPALPLDGAYAFSRALAEVFGFSQPVATPTFFGKKPPRFIRLQTGPGKKDYVEVPWGEIRVPGVEGYFFTSILEKSNGLYFRITGEMCAKHMDVVNEVAELTEHYATKESVYSGKALSFRFPDFGDWEVTDMPKFLDVADAQPDRLIFSSETMQQVEDSVFTPIRHTDQLRNYGVPLKRGVLLEGPYGVGKTLTAHVAAKLCEDNGWTFLYLEDVRQLSQAIDFAKRYGPAMIFAEDVDQATEGSRSVTMNEILNTIDGVSNKDAELMIVLTTNHVEKINPAMLRPGRLDAVVSIQPPTAEAALRLVQTYAGDLLDKDRDFTPVGEALAGQIPATIREAVERAKLSAITREPATDSLSLTPEDLLVAAEGMWNHMRLMEANAAQAPATEIEKASKIFAEYVVSGFERAVVRTTNAVGSLPNIAQPALTDG